MLKDFSFKKANDILVLCYTIIKLKSEKLYKYIKSETIHKNFVCPMGIISKLKNKKKKMYESVT